MNPNQNEDLFWDVDPSAKQVFSSDDLKLPTTGSDKQDEDAPTLKTMEGSSKNENINSSALDPHKAFEYFHSGKISSQQLHSRSTFSYNPDVAQESPLDRISRIKEEIQQLMQDLSGKSEQLSPSPTSSHPIGSFTDTPIQFDSEQLKHELGNLRTFLTSLENNQNVISPLQYEFSSFRRKKQELDLQLEGLKSTEKTPPKQSKNQQQTQQDEKPNDYAELERRISRIEKVVGPRDSSAMPLLQSAYVLKKQVSLLSEGQLQALEEKLKRITAKASSISSEGSQGESASSEPATSQSSNSSVTHPSASPKEPLSKNTEEAFETLTKLGPMLPLLPPVLKRLVVLQNLHQEAATFATQLRKLAQVQTEIEVQLQSHTLLGKELREGLQRNAETMKNNIDSLEKRLEALQKTK